MKLYYNPDIYVDPKSIYDTMSFGTHKGIPVGIVYLFDPNYIEWALRVTNRFCIKDIDLLQGLKTYASEKVDRSVLLANIGREIAYERVQELNISFNTLVHGGVHNFSFSKDAIEYNEKKLKQAKVIPTKSTLLKYNPQKTVFFLNLIEIDIWGTQTIKVRCKRIEEEYNYCNVIFDYDNSNNRNPYLPKIKHCNLGFVFSNSASNNSDSDEGITFQVGNVNTISFKNGSISEIE